MSKAIRIEQTGGPEVMQWVDVQVGDPGPGEVRVRHEAVGLNYIDVYFRTGLYKQPLPGGLGMEGAGVVEAVGEGVRHVAVGDRVAYAGRPTGAYAQVRVMPADIVVRLPDAIPFETAAAMMLQGLTAQYLIRDSYKVQPGDTVLLHAAAGGVGLIACQWLKALGVTVIGTVGSDEKAELARANGCAHTIVYTRESFVERVREITNGKGVPAVYDSIGKDTFQGSLDCLAPRGTMVSFGNASGPVPPFDLSVLGNKGSLRLTRPTLMTYVVHRELLEPMVADLFDAVTTGKVKVDIRQRYALSEVAQAHRDLESRKTTGSTILLPH
ncbi:quinone oxidoreductase family protein [Cupriavidus taiwanensis]|uniref:Quinone oxidoreductase, NADPH-dependent n=2 Tax=Cupriavidus taiwanensis TaxID=164546 RepID=B3R3G2_CUPTR|nr:quinone oxidoreductase [Cupriavidus taiwanensis]CAQ68844.1 quinone oxidoreductase, NADPH-dependent [Cupriavidus taiwanensis LMG 19424]SOY86157.1 quinone oxidoreductase, NADPH-dependent [Cupriavidus taiwanensis]SOZ01845.1 quinone oxidoreductase, NADPH-dependent [Cupriavidus taiwanensis]SOZ04844.1 quinone oxidoreductase, NADPH-dependent [Cupriavidus taiwanensis]SPC06742.1 quinone oxidoreductase, NADPH-dependent [Cupriavidus taiwanensis]